jgi:hypothetical protein
MWLTRPSLRAPICVALLALLPLFVLGCDSSDVDDDDLAALRTALACTTIGQISMGQTVNGTLSTSDCRWAVDQSYIDYYAFRLTSTTNVRIDLESAAFDTYLVLFNSTGGGIDSDDDGGVGYNSRITRQLAAGLYVIGANSFDVGATGAYTLKLTSGN